jgi:hypothetical protein
VGVIVGEGVGVGVMGVDVGIGVAVGGGLAVGTGVCVGGAAVVGRGVDVASVGEGVGDGLATGPAIPSSAVVVTGTTTAAVGCESPSESPTTTPKMMAATNTMPIPIAMAPIHRRLEGPAGIGAGGPEGGPARLCPHFRQNLAVFELLVPHAGQNTSESIGLT